MKKKIIIFVFVFACCFSAGIGKTLALFFTPKIFYFNTITAISNYNKYKPVKFNSIKSISSNLSYYTDEKSVKGQGVMYWNDGTNTTYTFNNKRVIFKITKENDCSNKITLKFNITYGDGKSGTATVKTSSCIINNDAPTYGKDNKKYYATKTNDDGSKSYATSPSISFYINSNNELEIFTNGLKQTDFKINYNENKAVSTALLDIDNYQSFKIGGTNITAVVKPSSNKNYTYYDLKQQSNNNFTIDALCPPKVNVYPGYSECDRPNDFEYGKSMILYKNNLNISFILGKRSNNVQMNSGGFTLSRENIYKDVTCGDLKTNCPYGYSYNNNDNFKIGDHNFKDVCCHTTPNTCSSFSCPAGTFKNASAKNTNTNGMTADQKKNVCCVNQCEYKPSSFDTDESKKVCCDFFKNDNYKNLPSGKTIDNFKDDFPECFEGSKVEFDHNDEICETGKAKTIKYSSYMNINGNKEYSWFNNLDGWIYLLNKENIIDKTNVSQLKENNYITGNITSDDYSTSSSCSLVCVDEINLNLPGGPNAYAQAGQHIVWPNNSNTKFPIAPLSVNQGLVCRAITSNVINADIKTACDKWGLDTVKSVNASTTSNFSLQYSGGSFDANVDLKSENQSEKNVTSSSVALPTRSSNLYRVNQTSNYGLNQATFTYSYKNKNILPASDNSISGSNINIGYGVLPIDWNSKVDDEYTLNLKYNLDSTSEDISGDYTCKFNIDPPGGSSDSCPLYTYYPNGKSEEFTKCLNEGGTKKQCINDVCYPDMKKYCPKDCVNGKCTLTSQSSRYRLCLYTTGQGVEHCLKTYCDQNNDTVVYRIISLSDPFPGINGEGRAHGSNWSDEDVAKVITNKQNVYEKEPMYEITLGPSSIKAIREYNDSADKMYGYLDFSLECNKDGKECRMKDFLFDQNISNIFNTNTCGWQIHSDKTQNWNGCDSRW